MTHSQKRNTKNGPELLLAGILLTAFIPAQAAKLKFNVNAPAEQPVAVDRNIPKGKTAGEYDVALLVGNGRYNQQGVPNVDFAHNDVKVMKTT